MRATASEPIHLGGGPRTASYRVAVDRDGAQHDDAVGVSRTRSVTPGGTPRTAGRGARLDVSRPMLRWRWSSALMDSVELLALVWSIPLAMLLVGAPIALAIALLVWLGRLALSAF